MAGIRIEGVEKRFGEVVALRVVRLEVPSGAFFTLLGPSGCGKTTLLRTLAGFERQDRGTIRIGEAAVDHLPPHRRDAAMVFQSYAVFPHLTVSENVGFGLDERGVRGPERAARVAAALARVRLDGLGERTPEQLSGGQRQRVALARAMVVEPRVLLMDEPLSNLDARLRISLREDIRDLQRALGITTVYVTHDQEEALAVSDLVAVMDQGVVRQVGSPWEVYRRPADATVAAFVGRMSFLAAEDLPGLDLPGEGPARVGVRPEDVRLVAPDAAPPSAGVLRLEGTVVHTTFTGPLLHTAVDLGEGREVLVEAHRPRADQRLEPGAPARLEVAAADLHPFCARTGARLAAPA